VRKSGAFSSREMVGCEAGPALRQSSAGQLEARVLAQMVEVVGIRIAAGNREDTRTQDVGDLMDDVRRAAVVRDQPGQRIHQAQPPVGAGQQQHAAIRTEPTAIEGGRDLLAAERW
jgi:hypothetical protein